MLCVTMLSVAFKFLIIVLLDVIILSDTFYFVFCQVSLSFIMLNALMLSDVMLNVVKVSWVRLQASFLKRAMSNINVLVSNLTTVIESRLWNGCKDVSQPTHS
jgi:hypothetical protein